ncbi:MAG TPA: SCP2 sterol-binding domain-containing protein [Chroococcales cyanobacterium]
MSVFSNTDELYSVMEELWRRIKSDNDMSAKLLESKLVVKFVYRDPDGTLTVDGSDGVEIKVYAGDCEIKPTIEMTMKSDVAHNFWLGKENPAMALISGRIASKGPVNKAMALLPAVKAAFQIYPIVVEDQKKTA